MASILQFAILEDGRPRRRKESTGKPGEVVIFPGVRIERHEGAEDISAQALRKLAQGS